MKDENKTKRELLQELTALRQEVASLRASSANSTAGRTSSPPEEHPKEHHEGHEGAASGNNNPPSTPAADLPVDFQSATPHQLTEAMLQEGEAGFRMLADTIAAIVVVHRNGRLLYVNPMTEAITGYAREELLAMNFADLLDPDFRQMTVGRGLLRQQGQ